MKEDENLQIFVEYKSSPSRSSNCPDIAILSNGVTSEEVDVRRRNDSFVTSSYDISLLTLAKIKQNHLKLDCFESISIYVIKCETELF